MIVRAESGVVPFNLLQESLWFSRDHLQVWLREEYGANYDRMIGTATGASEQTTEFDCNAHYLDLNLDAVGSVNLCGKVTLGNLNQIDLHSLWHGKSAQEFRLEVETDRGPCMTCDYRQRCLSPSMSLIDNHFSEQITGVLSGEAREVLKYDRSISDDEARWHFVRDLSSYLGVFEIAYQDVWTARRVSAGDTPGTYELGETLRANTRHELHQLMRGQANSDLNGEFVETHGRYNLVAYQGGFWALPMSLGYVNVTREVDRRKPGVLFAKSLDELRKMCGPANWEPPKLLGSVNEYNIVRYEGAFWGIPLAFGPFDLTDPVNHTREGLKVAQTLEELHRECGGTPTTVTT
jgi:radical SAM protein with 4Fe4S-binding SPASM domain